MEVQLINVCILQVSNKARRESSQKNMPMTTSVSPNNCLLCVHLHLLHFLPMLVVKSMQPRSHSRKSAA